MLGGGSSVWNTASGNDDINYTAGNVGIGTTSPNFRMSFGDGTTNTEWSNGKGILAIHETGGNYFYGLGLGSHDSVNNGGLCLWGGTEEMLLQIVIVIYL